MSFVKIPTQYESSNGPNEINLQRSDSGLVKALIDSSWCLDANLSNVLQIQRLMLWDKGSSVVIFEVFQGQCYHLRIF